MTKKTPLEIATETFKQVYTTSPRKGSPWSART